MNMNNHGKYVLLALRNELRPSTTLGYCANHQHGNGIVEYIYVQIVFIFQF